MFNLDWIYLNKEFRGALFIFFGIILLLHTLGILQQWLNLFLIFISLALIAYGLFEARPWEKVKFLKEDKKSK